MRKCLWCEKTLTGKQRKFCSIAHKLCYYTTKNRIETKKRAVAYKGGCCKFCGYNRSLRALEFHHVNPEEKSFGVSAKGLTRSWESLKEELDKCVLVCSNCHAEIEDGLITVV